ncbi:MAG TPA: PorV/PorQ family protein [bacterium]|nr:PorV/PorQ family protein [bacterium]
MRLKLVFVCLFGLLTGVSEAEVNGDAGRESPFSIGIGARGLGLGGASVAFPEDASAFSWNPAGMLLVQSKNALFSQTTLFEGVQYHFIGYVHPTLNAGVFGFGFSRVGTDGIPGYEEIQGVPVSTGDFDYWWGKLSLAYALPVYRGLAVGLNLEVNRQVMGSQYATNGFGLDTGIHYTFPGNGGFLDGLHLGMNLVHAVNPRMKLGTRTETLPTVTRIGLAKAFSLRDGQDRLVFLSDVDWLKNRKLHYHLGGEYAFDHLVFFRMGVDQGSLSFGGGIRYRAIQFDYATAKMSESDFFRRSHLFSLSVHIGKSLPETREELRLRHEEEMQVQLQEKMEQDRRKRIRDALQSGQEYLHKGDYFNARIEFNRVLREDRNNTRAQEFLRITEERELEWQQARQDSILREERERLEIRQNLELVNARLKEGNQAMERGDYQRAIERWREALAVDPGNAILIRYIQQARGELERQVNRAISRARNLVQQENLSEARNVLEQARSQAVGIPSLENLLNQEIRRLAQAVDYVSNVQAGIERFNRGQFEEAVPFFKRALEYQPDNDRILTLYRNAMARSAKDERPLSEEEQREVRGKMNEGLRLYRDGRYEEALQVWEEALILDPHNVNLIQAIEGAKQKLQTFRKP